MFGLRPSDDPRVEFWCEGDPSRPEAAHVTRRGTEVIHRFPLLEHGAHLDAAIRVGDQKARERVLMETRFTVLCERARMDALVTESRRLLSRDPHVFLYGSPDVLGPADAIALAGLFLRSRGEFSSNVRKAWLIDWKSAEDFYRALSFVLVPSSRFWLGATLPRRARDIYDETYTVHAAIARSITWQLARALRARDHLQILRRGEFDPDVAFEIAGHFEYALISLSGAFDTLAHIFAVAHGITKQPMDNWRKEAWRKKLRTDPSTAHVAAVADSDEVQRTLALLGELRNTVHGPSLEPRINEAQRRKQAVVLVPPTRLVRFDEALARWHSIPKGSWGVKYERRGNPRIDERDDGTVFACFSAGPDDPIAEINVDPGICLERLLVVSIDAIERLAQAIDWSRLGGAAFLPLSSIPPGDDFVQERLRLLGGVW